MNHRINGRNEITTATVDITRPYPWPRGSRRCVATLAPKEGGGASCGVTQEVAVRLHVHNPTIDLIALAAGTILLLGFMAAIAVLVH